MLGCRLALRPGELLGLAWDDVDFGQAGIRLRFSLKKIDGKLVRAPLKTEKSKGTIDP